jgi:hypothetical protein
MNPPVQRTIPILIATAVVLFGGAIQGISSHRWTTDTSLAQAAARLDRVALNLGDWKGQALEYNSRDYRRAGIDGALLRRYVDVHTGETVMLLIVCGRPGPISVHTPEVCYAAAGYEVLGSRVRLAIATSTPEKASALWKIELRKLGTIVPEYLGVYYGWTMAGVWQAPDGDARIEFGGNPFLYKMYVIHESSSAGDARGEQSCLAFIRAVEPALRKSLFSAA